MRASAPSIWFVRLTPKMQRMNSGLAVVRTDLFANRSLRAPHPLMTATLASWLTTLRISTKLIEKPRSRTKYTVKDGVAGRASVARARGPERLY
jgi:hypothetical protein